MIKCGITGSSGVLGKKILKLLPYKFNEFKGNILNLNHVKKWVKNSEFDILLHLASKVSICDVNKNFSDAHNVNVKGTKNLIETIFKENKKLKWFFFASTSHVYKLPKSNIKIKETSKILPSSNYGLTKKLAEDILIKKFNNKNKINICIGRIFSYTDENQKVPFLIPSLIKRLSKSNKVINLNDMEHFRDFLPTSKIVSAINELRKINAKGVYNIGSGQKFYLKSIAKLLAIKYKKKLKFENTNNKTFLVSNNNKLIKDTNWKPPRYKKRIDYFYK